MTRPATIRVMLPIATTTESNAKGHWRPKAERARKQRTTAYLTLLGPLRSAALRLKRGHRDQIDVLMVRVSWGALDDDNLSSACKHVRDGIADALGIDDRDPRVRWLYGQERGIERTTKAVRIVIDHVRESKGQAACIGDR